MYYGGDSAAGVARSLLHRLGDVQPLNALDLEVIALKALRVNVRVALATDILLIVPVRRESSGGEVGAQLALTG